ncbi:hypothetical protein AMAG_09615 [Allomyces macrogynus ATCC 38327]|uniref:S1/P1 Nuclease n=1 Tax=Allomyces macrogynus (strain ATCC 38327) TaxID=578462 RepID=A0A0L0SST9_ALLM3|nr:hypothetical protein AMAG_09615 [Allomyces macrogynus ATCC 38327]|eukprot:KNE65633.1 hypothetical protein AMAG_09615 [Allomyces macrogynus ATCC 38327]
MMVLAAVSTRSPPMQNSNSRRNHRRLHDARGVLALATVALVLLVMTCAPRTAVAWGDEGHRAVGSLAYSALSPRAKVAVEKLLKAGTFRSIEYAAVWPDRIKRKRPATGAWHYANSHDAPEAHQCMLTYPRDCEDGTCAMTAIARMATTLARHRDLILAAADPAAMPMARELGESLAFLIHIVGDIAQPLHATGFKRGANDVPVTLDGTHLSLHALWDYGLIRKSIGADYQGSRPQWVAAMLHTVRATALAEQVPVEDEKVGMVAINDADSTLARLGHVARGLFGRAIILGAPTARAIRQQQAPELAHAVVIADTPDSTDPIDPASVLAALPDNDEYAPSSEVDCAVSVDVRHVGAMTRCATRWAQQSNRLVCKSVFGARGAAVEGMVIDDAYWRQGKDVINTQIIRAGLRLAALLNRIFDDESVGRAAVAEPLVVDERAAVVIFEDDA